MTAPGSRVAALPAHLRKRLADAYETAMLPDCPSPLALRSVLGMRDGTDELRADLTELARIGITGRAVAAWVRSLERAARRTPAPDLVWSGPEVPGLHARDTRRVYEELIRNATESVWMSTYVYFDGPRAFADLAQRMDEVAGLRAVLMLNIQRTRGDTTAPRPARAPFRGPLLGQRLARHIETGRLLRPPAPSTSTAPQACSTPKQ